MPDLRFLLLCLIVATVYSWLRLTLNVEYAGATWEQLYDLSAPIPFGYRILVPLLSRPLVAMGLEVGTAFLVWEMLATTALLLGLRAAFLSLGLERRGAELAALAFLSTLPWAFLLKTPWPVFYPHDTAAMALLAWSLVALMFHRWILLGLLCVLATLNRESAFLIPLMFIALFADRTPLRPLLALSAMLLGAYLATRASVAWLVRDNPQPYGGGLAILKDGALRLDSNLAWMADAGWMVLVGTLGMLPVLWWWVRANIPAPLGRLGLLAGMYLAMLAFVGNAYEPRIFGESMVLAWIPIVLGLQTHRVATVPGPGPLPALRDDALARFVQRIETHAVTLILVGTLFAAAALHFRLPAILLR